MRGFKSTLLALSAMLCVIGCADPESGDAPDPDPDRDRVLEVLTTLRPEVEAALGDSLGAEVEVVRVTEEELKEKVKETVHAQTREKLPDDRFEDAWDTLLLMQGFPGAWGGFLGVITDLKGRLCFVKLPEENERLRPVLTNELIRIYQLRNLGLFAFLRTAGNAEEEITRRALVDAHKRFVARRLREARGEPPFSSDAKARKKNPVSLMIRQLREGIIEGAAFEAQTDRYIAGRSEGLATAEAWKRIFAAPPKSIWEVLGVQPEEQPGYELAVRARTTLPSHLTITPLLPILPGALEGAVLAAGADPASLAGGLLVAGFSFTAESPTDGAYGGLRVRVITAADEDKARKLAEIWLAAERSFDEYARAGSRFSALAAVSYESVSLGNWRGTRIRRLEEDRSDMDSEFLHGPWDQQEALVLTSGPSLFVLQMSRPFEFVFDPLELVRRVLPGAAAAPWPETTNHTEESLQSLLSHPDPQLRWWSLYRLEEEDWDHKLPREILGPLLYDADLRVRAGAFRILAGQLDRRRKTSQALLPGVLANCTPENAELRANAFLCLNRIAESPRQEMRILLDGLNDPVATVRYRALEAWTADWSDDVSPPATAVATLLRMAKDPVEQIRQLAMLTIERLDSSIPGLAPVLLKILTAENEDLRIAATRAFRHSHDDSEAVIEALRLMSKKDESERVREAAGCALGWLTGE
jgi:hypothetical protein